MLATLIAASGVAAADPHPMGTGAHFSPQPEGTQEKDVRIAREDLRLRVDLDAVDVTATFILENRGAATTREVGFPCRHDPSGVSGIALRECNTPISVESAHRKVSTHALRHGTSGVDVWTMRFSAGEQVPLRISYRTPLVNKRYPHGLDGLFSLHYQLTTGARWAGPIGELHMELELPLTAVAHIAPPGYRRTAHRITWDLRDYTPTEDLVILFEPMFNGAFRDMPTRYRRAKGDERAKIEAELEDFLKRLRTGSSDFVMAACQNIHRYFKLPCPPPERIESTLSESAELLRDAVMGPTPP